jgi:hypothetical protein
MDLAVRSHMSKEKNLSVVRQAYVVPISQTSTRQVDAYVVVGPTQMIVPSVVELLVRVVDSASPNLEVDAVRGFSVRNIQTFIAEDLDGTASERPLLRGCARAWLFVGRRGRRKEVEGRQCELNLEKRMAKGLAARF